MAKYIDADALGEFVVVTINNKPVVPYWRIKEMKGEDVAPVIHAHWIEDRGDLICSNCYECYSDEIVFMSRCKDVYDLPHCPTCGAKMDEEI